MAKELNDSIAVNLMSRSVDGDKELSHKTHHYDNVINYGQQQAIMMIKKQESDYKNKDGNQTTPSLRNFNSVSENPYFIPMHHIHPHSDSYGHSSIDEATRKREIILLKNKEEAKECRRKKKEYVRCLEDRVNLLENQNKNLIEELK